jgi:hypothetical protein
MEAAISGAVQHKIDIETIEDYFQKFLGYTPKAEIEKLAHRIEGPKAVAKYLAVRRCPTSLLTNVVLSGSWHEAEKHLSEAYELVARLHDELRISSYMAVLTARLTLRLAC